MLGHCWSLVCLGSAGCRGDTTWGASEVSADTCVLETELHLPGHEALQEQMPPGCSGAGEGSEGPFSLHRGRTCPRTSGAPQGLIFIHPEWAQASRLCQQAPAGYAVRKPDSFINTHHVNCCNLKAGFPLRGCGCVLPLWKCTVELSPCGEGKMFLWLHW